MIAATVRAHWPEYLIEAGCLATFMVSAAAFATLLQHPASPWMLHAAPEFLARLPMGAAMGLTDGLVRLSCGVEDVGDLLADLEQAFEGIPGSGKRPAGSGKREAGSGNSNESRDTIRSGVP